MIFTSVLALAALSLPTADVSNTNLERVFKKGEKLSYRIESGLQVEERQLGLHTWMPSHLDMRYDFSLEVVEMKADGIAVMRYLRPSVTQITGETHEAPAQTHVEKLNWDLLLTVSPINELLDVKDQTKRPARAMMPLVSGGRSAQDPLREFLDRFIGEIYRLSLFIGSLDSSLDFSPKLPFDDVKVGETWKRTVGYQPQRLQGSDKLAVQRLDYTYTYKGPTTVNNRKVERVQADLDLNTDLAAFIHSMFEVDSDVTGLTKVSLKLKAVIEFDLDPTTRHTLAARATTEGGFQIFIKQFPETAVEEQKLRGRTVLRLLPPAPAPARSGRPGR
jgi:hypothetical protein